MRRGIAHIEHTGASMVTDAHYDEVCSSLGGLMHDGWTSLSGLQGNFGQANYAAAKAGVYGLTRTASVELQKYAIKVNAVAPLAKTRLTADLPMFEKIGGTLSPEHVAPVHVYLASDLSGDRTGLVIGVAGARLSIFRVVESGGRYKDEEGGVWTASEIADHFDAIAKI